MLTFLNKFNRCDEGLDLWWLTKLSTILQLYRGGQGFFLVFLGGGVEETVENDRPVVSH